MRGSPAPTSVSRYLQIGLAREKRGDLRGALSAFQQARERDPSNPQLLVAVARVYVQLDRLPDALAALTELVPLRSARITTDVRRAALNTRGPVDPQRALHVF